MKKRENKSGENYLIAGIIILLLLSIFIFFIQKNFFNNSNFSEIKDDKINFEKVLEYGEYSNKIDKINLIKEMKEKYSKQLENEGKLYFLFMDDSQAILIEYREIYGGKIILNDASRIENKITEEVYNRKEIEASNNLVEFSINNEEYFFEINPKQSRYAIIGE